MNNRIYVLTWLMILTSCASQEINPRIDKIVLLSGQNPNGKQWKMTSVKSISNYCTNDLNKFQTTELWNSYPESIKDNMTRIYPDGKVEIDEGKIRYHEDSPQIYMNKQFWSINSTQDSVAIVDYVGLPSINSKWGLQATTDKIVLTRKELDIVFKRSFLSQSVTFDLVSIK